MNIELQKKWAYIALRATATPPPPTTEQIAQRFKDKVIVPYQFNSHAENMDDQAAHKIVMGKSRDGMNGMNRAAPAESRAIGLLAGLMRRI